MSTIQSPPLAQVLGSEAPGDPVDKDPESELSILTQQLSDALDRLDVISPSSFNISELVFTTSSNDFANPGSMLDADIIVAALDPDARSTHRFRSTVRALEFLERDLVEIIDNSRPICDELVSKCEDAVARVNLELRRLLAAAQMHQGRQIVTSQAHIRLGVRRVDLPRNAHPAHCLDPLTISVVIIISTIHCFMNISRENCDFIIRAMLAMLRVAFRTQRVQDVHIFRRIDRVPTTLETSLHYLDIHPDLVFYAPPTGSLRFKPPVAWAPSSSDQTINATVYGPSCPQGLANYVSSASEDCLTLDIWKPTNITEKLPVMVWIYGGGFYFGTSQGYEGWYMVQPSIPAGKPFIYVALNYRTGLFGFPPGTKSAAAGALNLGLKDQRLALEWVQENIEYFGGDKTRVRTL
ncbi:carboxylesterase, partial [Rhizoctonia solani AG-3 Rhs1AP]